MFKCIGRVSQYSQYFSFRKLSKPYHPKLFDSYFPIGHYLEILDKLLQRDGDIHALHFFT